MADEHKSIGRTTAGRAAVIVMDEQGHEIGSDMLLGMMCGFAAACAEVIGWDATLAEIRQLATASRVPAEVEKPVLSVVRGGK